MAASFPIGPSYPWHHLTQSFFAVLPSERPQKGSAQSLIRLFSTPDSYSHTLSDQLQLSYQPCFRLFLLRVASRVRFVQATPALSGSILGAQYSPAPSNAVDSSHS